MKKKKEVKLSIFTAISLIIILFGMVVIAVDPSTPIGYFVKITSDTIRDVTSDLIKDITTKFLKITGYPTSTASFTYSAAAAPYLSQNIPNQTWDEDTNISINLSLYFSDPNDDDLSYSVFNSVDNITITINNNTNLAYLYPDKNFYGIRYVIFNVTDGTYTNSSNNVTLTVNAMPEINLSYYSGLTTDITLLNSTQLQNVTNFTLENTQYAFLRFTVPVNISYEINFNNDSYINISSNLIFINTTLFPQLNKSAEIKFYNLTFTNPQILKDGEVCPSTICTELSYSGGTFFFNVSHFSTYTTRETPVVEREMPPAAAAAVSPGGGGGGAARAATFILSKDTIKLVVSPGIKKTVDFNVKGISTVPQEFSVEVEGVKEFVSIDTKFSLEPAQAKDISLVINIPEEQELGIYTGRINVKSGQITKKIDVIIEAQSLEPVFDVDVDVLKTHKKIIPGGEVLAQINLYELRTLGKVNVNLYYYIKNTKGNDIVTEKDTISFEGQTNYIKSITLPKVEPDTYVFAVKAIYQGSVGTATDIFEVIPITELPSPIKVFAPLNIIIWLGALLVITLIVLVVLDIIIKSDLIRSVKKNKVLQKKERKKKRRKKGKPILKIWSKKIIKFVKSKKKIRKSIKKIKKEIIEKPRVIEKKEEIKPIKKILDIKSDCAEIVRKRREELNISQDELALMLKEKKSVVHRIENKELKPDLFLAKKLEKALHIKLIEEVEE